MIACMDDGQNDDFINRMVLKFLAQSSGTLPAGIGLGLHPLDVFRRSMLTGKHHKIRSPQDIEDDNAIIRSAVELYEAGIQFKPSKTLSLHDIQALPGGEEEAAKVWEEEFTHYLPAIEEDDFLGVQNYTRARYDQNGSMTAPEGAELTQMDYEFYPEALEHVLRRVAKDFHGDLIVTENGIATADDTRRVAFIERALAGVQNCLTDGLPVKGYFHWSLLDNFEWQKGFAMQFGLIAVDRAHGQTRTPKPSLAFLGRYAAKA